MGIGNIKSGLCSQKLFSVDADDHSDINLDNQQELKSFLTDNPINFSEKKSISGLVVKIDGDDKNPKIVLDIGGKVEGMLFKSELERSHSPLLGENCPKDYHIGDIIKVYVKEADPMCGYASLNRENVIREEVWDELEKKFENSDIVDGFIFNKVKCGLIVDLQGTVAFLPGSQVDTKIIKDIEPLMGKRQPFIILKMDKEQGNIVVSRRAVLESSMRQQRTEILESIVEGDVLQGTVKNITKYGAFIDLGGIDGLAHITDLSWKRCNHPFEILSLGQIVKVKVIKFDKEKKRISLGLKQLEESPWATVAKDYPVGTETMVTITSIADYGIFAELDNKQGVEGLIYQTEISWSRAINNNPSNYFQKGQDIKARVLEIDADNLRMSLSIKQCTTNPWIEFAEKYEGGQVIEVKVKHIVDFGIFVDLPCGESVDAIDGLIYYSDLSWTEPGDVVIKKFKKGDLIKAKILIINPEKERISLGIKQIEKDPMGDMIKTLEAGQLVEGVVNNVFHDDILVELCEGFEIPIDKNSFASNPKKMAMLNSLNLYSKVQLKIMEIIPKFRLIKVDFMKKL